MHQASTNSLSVVVTQDHLQALWIVTWYVLSPDGRLLTDGRRELSTDQHDSRELEAITHDLYGKLLKLR